MLTQQELKLNLSFNPETGIFTWLVANNGRVKVGMIAGSLSSTGYLYIMIDRKNYKSHRLAWLYMTGEWPKKMIDHIDGEKSNNRIVNLRDCNQSQNMQNMRASKINASGYKGVSWHNATSKWRSRAKLKRKQYHLGLFEHAEDASQAYQNFAKQNHGEFYREASSHP